MLAKRGAWGLIWNPLPKKWSNSVRTLIFFCSLGPNPCSIKWWLYYLMQLRQNSCTYALAWNYHMRTAWLKFQDLNILKIFFRCLSICWQGDHIWGKIKRNTDQNKTQISPWGSHLHSSRFFPVKMNRYTIEILSIALSCVDLVCIVGLVPATVCTYV